MNAFTETWLRMIRDKAQRCLDDPGFPGSSTPVYNLIMQVLQTPGWVPSNLTPDGQASGDWVLYGDCDLTRTRWGWHYKSQIELDVPVAALIPGYFTDYDRWICDAVIFILDGAGFAVDQFTLDGVYELSPGDEDGYPFRGFPFGGGGDFRKNLAADGRDIARAVIQAAESRLSRAEARPAMPAAELAWFLDKSILDDPRFSDIVAFVRMANRNPGRSFADVAREIHGEKWDSIRTTARKFKEAERIVLLPRTGSRTSANRNSRA